MHFFSGLPVQQPAPSATPPGGPLDPFAESQRHWAAQQAAHHQQQQQHQQQQLQQGHNILGPRFLNDKLDVADITKQPLSDIYQVGTYMITR